MSIENIIRTIVREELGEFQAYLQTGIREELGEFQAYLQTGIREELGSFCRSDPGVIPEVDSTEAIPEADSTVVVEHTPVKKKATTKKTVKKTAKKKAVKEPEVVESNSLPNEDAKEEVETKKLTFALGDRRYERTPERERIGRLISRGGYTANKEARNKMTAVMQKFVTPEFREEAALLLYVPEEALETMLADLKEAFGK